MPDQSAFTCPPLRTRRFHLEPLAERYATDVFELRADEEVSRYLDRSLMQRPEEALSFVREILSYSRFNFISIPKVEYQVACAGR